MGVSHQRCVAFADADILKFKGALRMPL